MKIVTILGVRPEIIRLSCIIKKLDNCCEHTVLYTGQNYDDTLSSNFIKEFEFNTTNWIFNNMTEQTLFSQIGPMFKFVSENLERIKPDKVLILGDTNTSLCAIVCARMGIPVYHMEAGNRCFDPLVPEEINRRIIDHISTFNMPYTNKSKEHLLSEGLPYNRIFITGNPIYEVYLTSCPTLKKQEHNSNNLVVATIHRNENVSSKNRLLNIINILFDAHLMGNRVVLSCHPKTLDYIKKFDIDVREIEVLSPLGFKDFAQLLWKSKFVITDSGTVQEESCLLGKPCLVLRRSSERMECVENGASILGGVDDLEQMRDSLELISHKKFIWKIPQEYLIPNVSEIVVGYLLGSKI